MEIYINDLKLYPIINQNGTHLYDLKNYCPIFTAISNKGIKYFIISWDF